MWVAMVPPRYGVILAAARLARVAAGDTAVASVRAWLAARPDATTLPVEALSPSVRFDSDLCTLRGAREYVLHASRWHADAARLLRPYHTSAVRVVALDEGAVAVRWRAVWEPATLAWAPPLARLLRWRVQRFDVDARSVPTFRWGAVFVLFRDAFATGTLQLRCVT